MTAVIKNETTVTFSMNGIDYQKNYTPLLIGDNIMLISAYDSKQVILKSTHYSEFTINGFVPASASDCISALVPLLFTKDIVTPGGSSRTNSTTLQFYNSVEGVTHINQGDDSPLTDSNYTVDLTNAVEGGVVVLHYNGSVNPNISGATIRAWSGNITALGNYVIYLHYTGGKLNIKTFGLTGTVVADTTAPVWITGNFEVGLIADNIVVLPCNELLNGLSVPDLGDFAITKGGVANPVLNVNLSVANQVRLTLTNAIVNGDAVTAVYTPNANPVEDLAGNDAPQFGTPTPVTINNNVGAVAGDWGLNFDKTQLDEFTVPFTPPTDADWSLSFIMPTKAEAATNYLMGSNTIAMADSGNIAIRNGAANSFKLSIGNGTSQVETGNILYTAGEIITIDFVFSTKQFTFSCLASTLSIDGTGWVAKALTLVFGDRIVGGSLHSNFELKDLNLNGENSFFTEGTGLTTTSGSITGNIKRAGMWKDFT